MSKSVSETVNSVQTPLLPPPAPRLRRLSALLLDNILLGLLLVPLVFSAVKNAMMQGTLEPSQTEYCVDLGIAWAYYIIGGCIFRGNTPGKQMLGLRVLKLPQLKPLSFRDIVFRSGVFLLFCCIHPLFWLNCFWTCIRKQHRSFHDLCCRTYVADGKIKEPVNPTVCAGASAGNSEDGGKPSE